MIFLLSTAFATTYDVELAVPSQHYLAASTTINAERVIAYDKKLDDVFVTSSHPLITCYSEKGYIVVSMNANKTDYPSSFPFAATCTYANQTLNISVVTMSTATDPSLQDWSIDGNNAVHITRSGKATILRPYRLRESVASYKIATVKAIGLSGVSCEVFTMDGKEFVYVHSVQGADTGTGVCSMPLVNGTLTDLTVHLAEAAI